MQIERRLVRSRARDDVYSLVREMIAEGELPPGERLGEMELSARLGVSRTPLREALIALERDGLVGSAPNKGFAVAGAGEGLVRESFPILGALEAAAVELSMPDLERKVPELRRLNAALAGEIAPGRQHELDWSFHRLLTDDCGSARLLDLLDVERVRASRFDGGAARGVADVAGSCADHAAIIEAIANGDAAAAGDGVRRHWTRGAETVVRWLSKDV